MEQTAMIIQLTGDEKEDIFRMRSEGSTMKEIAEYIGCCIQTVSYHLKAAGICCHNRWDSKLDEVLIESYNSGKTCAEIAKEVKRTKSNVNHRISYLRKLGKPIKYHKK